MQKNPQHWMSVSQLIGKKVKNQYDQDLGSIQEVMIETGEFKIAYVILKFSQLLGLDTKLFAVPYKSFEFNGAEAVLHIDKDRLKEAPGYDPEHLPNVSDPVWQESVYAYWGKKPLWDPR